MNWKGSLSCAAAALLVVCCIWQARSEAPAVAPEKEDTGIRIESVMGKGFGTLFTQEVLLEKVDRDPNYKNARPYWIAKVPDASKSVAVSGFTAKLQKEIEAWAQDHPGVTVKVAAYETIEVSGMPALPIGPVIIDGVPVDASAQSRGWSAGTELIVVGIAGR